MNPHHRTASIILAAGRGTRMQGYSGNKTLLPLEPDGSIYRGQTPILKVVMGSLPDGPKALIVNHCKEEVIAATRHLDPLYFEQPELNGTGGALLAADQFVRRQPDPHTIITMGDVPFVRRRTYAKMTALLDDFDMVVLGFRPADRKQYGVLELKDERVTRIVEWKYWRTFPPERQAELTVCNAGIYAFHTEVLERYLPVMANRPQIVQKWIDGRLTSIEEYFLTDLVEFMNLDRRPVGYLLTEDEHETMGIDDPPALEKAQAVFARTKACFDTGQTENIT